MPLAHGKSDVVFRQNVSEMIKAGHPRAQALAAAYREKRGFASGGSADTDLQFPDMSAEDIAKAVPPRAFGTQQPVTPSPVLNPPPAFFKNGQWHRSDEKPPGVPTNGGYAKGGKAKKFADGGIPTSEALSPWYTRAEFRDSIHPEGLVTSTGAGRTDVHNINVPAGSYVWPADVVSGLSEGNTLGGAEVIDRMLHSNPYGIQGGGGKHGSGPPHVSPPRPFQEPKDNFALESRGGKAGKHEDGIVPIVVAGGEVITHPHSIIQKFGSLKRGHAILDKTVKNVRAKNVKTISKLPGPRT